MDRVGLAYQNYMFADVQIRIFNTTPTLFYMTGRKLDVSWRGDVERNGLAYQKYMFRLMSKFAFSTYFQCYDT